MQMFSEGAVSADLNLEELIGRPVSNRKQESKERKAEQQRRYNEYRRVALQALSKVHEDDYNILYAQAKKYVDQQRGPLPD